VNLSVKSLSFIATNSTYTICRTFPTLLPSYRGQDRPDRRNPPGRSLSGTDEVQGGRLQLAVDGA
jgi:hypothetical protein